MGYQYTSRLTDTLNLCLIYFKIAWALVILLENMHKKFELNQTKIKGSCQLGRKVATHNSKSDLPLADCRQLWLTSSIMKQSTQGNFIEHFQVSKYIPKLSKLSFLLRQKWKCMPECGKQNIDEIFVLSVFTYFSTNKSKLLWITFLGSSKIILFF